MSHRIQKIEEQFWNTSDIATLLQRSESHIRQRIVTSFDFPAAYKLPSKKGCGQRLWKSSEVMAWLEKQREGA